MNQELASELKLMSTAEVIEDFGADEVKLQQWAEKNGVQQIEGRFVWTPRDIEKLDEAHEEQDEE